MTLSPGNPAPEIRAPNQHGDPVEPDFEEPTVLYFYPEDGTPGCKTEAAQFQAERDIYDEAGITVYGVSTDDVSSHRAFAEEGGIEFDLLADPDGEVADAFGIDIPGGRADRTTFVLANDEVVAVYEDVDPDGHAREVMFDLLDAGLVELEGF